MKIKTVPEKPLRPSPFNPKALWRSAQWFGDELMSCETEVADFFYGFVKAVKPETLLETGTFKGFSTCAFAAAMKNNGFGHITTIDLNDYKFIPYVLKKKDVEKHFDGTDIVLKQTENVFDIFPKYIEDGKKFNMIFIDDDHSDEHVKKELEFLPKLITSPGYILFHDTYFTVQGKIGDTIEAWAKKQGYNHMRLYTSRGLDIIHVK